MDPTIWGPHYWFVLHTMAFHYPEYPTTIQKKIYHRFVHHLPEFIPNKTISTTYEHILKKHPVTPYLDSRVDFIKWMHFLHNKINERLDKPTITLAEHYEEFGKNFETKQTKLHRLWKEKQKVLFTIAIGTFLIYLYVSTSVS